MIYIDQPSLFLRSEKYYEWNVDDMTYKDTIIKYKRAYKTYFTSLAAQFCTDLGQNCEDLETEAEEVYQFENFLAQISEPSSNRSFDDDLTWNKMKISDLEASVPEMGIFTTLASIFSRVNYTVTSETLINDQSVTFFEALNSEIDDVNLETLNNFMVFRIVPSFIDALPETYKKIRDDFNAEFKGVSKRRERYEDCIDATLDALPFPTSALYLHVAYPPEAKKSTDIMVEAILDSFKNKILKEQVDWMDEETKKMANEKVDSIVSNMGYPDYIVTDKSRLDAEYADLKVSSNLFQNYVDQLNFEFLNSLAKIKRPIDSTEWSTRLPPAVVNAYYSPTQNSINFPAGILQFPFYDRYQSMASNFGAIGVVIGHELTHGFDDSGSQYGADGNKFDWWNTETRKNFDERGEGMADQYSKYFWDQAGKNLDGKATLGENIADNGGLRESFFAYGKWASENKDFVLPGMQDMSWKQQFFLGYAQVWCSIYTDEEASNRIDTDVHSPAPFRVLGPLSNFEEFGKAFQCKKGTDVYYPEETQRVW